MEGYPDEYFTTPLPLLVLSGLGGSDTYTDLPPYPSLENGTLITSDLPPVTSPVGKQLLKQFFEFSGQEKWIGTLKRGGRPPNSPSFKIVSAGRNFVLPPRKALAPTMSNPSSPFLPEPPSLSGTSTPRSLHSPISPLSPESPLYPDGIFTHIWLRKHLSLLPCAFLSVHELHLANPPNQKEDDAKDSVLVNSINDMRKVIAAEHKKCKFAVILIAPKSILEAPAIEDRFAHIRRTTQLDTKSSLFFLPAGASVVEMQQFAKTVEMALVPSAIEYYRELTKHSRRKRNRGTIPAPTLPPSTTSQALSTVGWTVRYELKLAIFAEFRGEMDIAARNFETAYEGIMEVFETTNSYSPRWLDSRIVADVVAAKIIRCHIFLENTTVAARRWAMHRRRMAELVDRRGAGTNSYGWAAWMSRWAEIMATIVRDAGLMPPDNKDDIISSLFFASADKTIKVDDRVAPIEFLHHAGFYWLMSANYMKLRRRRAKRIAESDTMTDNYMCPAPEDEANTDHISLIVRPLENAATEFEERKQIRLASRIAFDLAVLEMERGEYKSALILLKGCIRLWRQEFWVYSILQDALWRMRECAVKCGDIAAVVLSDLELHADVFDTREGWRYDLVNCLTGVDGVVGTTSLVVRTSDIVSLLSASYTFNSPEVCVGDYAVSQVSITYTAQSDAQPLTFSEFKLTHEGNLKPILVKHEESGSKSKDTALINLQGTLQERTTQMAGAGSKSLLEGSADLTFHPGQTKIYQLASILRDAGAAKITSLTLGIEGSGFEVDLMVMMSGAPDETDIGGNGNAFWWSQASDKPRKTPMRTDMPGTINILPKPPKMELGIDTLADPLFLDEPVKVKISVTNGEEDEAVAKLKIRLLGYPDEVPLIHWDPVNGTDDVECDPETPYEIGSLKPDAQLSRAFTFPAPMSDADIVFEISALYYLVSDKETPIVKTITIPQIRVRQPFRTKFDFSPSVHFAPWPNYFKLLDDDDDQDDEKKPKGIVQKWCLKSGIALSEGGMIHVEDVTCDVVRLQGGVVCDVAKTKDDMSAEKPEVLENDKTLENVFMLDITKLSLEDRRASALDIELKISWRRKHGELVQTILTVPRLMIPGSEPRVLAIAQPSTSTPPLHHLSYILENPTMHVLTFSITMEANDAFAFSGSKQLALQMMPLSRHSISYNLMPFAKNTWIRPNVKIVDKYYNKNLRISACEGTKGDKGQVLVYVPP